MTYKITNNQNIFNLRWVILISLLSAAVILLFPFSLRFTLAVIFISSVLVVPQIYLWIQYRKATRFDSFEIDYTSEILKIKNGNHLILKKLSDLKSIQYNQATGASHKLSLLLKLSEHFYYYKFEFKDGESYYLTCLLFPNPKFDENGVFYPYFINVERTYASLK